MLRNLVLADEMLLFACVSMYFGTGWSTALFSFPIIPRLTVDNYYLHFVPQVRSATRTFTVLTTLITATGLAMLADEWGSGLMWVPIVVVAVCIGSATLTVRVI